MSSGVSAPSTLMPSVAQRDFFVRLPQRCLLERFARLDDAAWQRDLPAVPAESSELTVSTMCARVVNGKDQQQTCGISSAREIETRRPFAPWDGLERGLDLGAWQLALKRGLELADDICEEHSINSDGSSLNS